MNLEGYKKLAIGLFENFQKIEYCAFLESIKTEHNKALVESVQKGFGAIYEADMDEEGSEEVKEDKSTKVNPVFRDYVRLTQKLKQGVVAKFQRNAREETEKMAKVLNEGKGHVKVDPLHKFKDFSVVTDYEYSPEGESTEEDKENARAVLASTVLPVIVYNGVQIGRTPAYEEAALDFIADAIEQLPGLLDKFKYQGSSFLNYYHQFGLRNLKKYAIAKAEGTSVTSKVWNAEREYKKGDVVNHGSRNWKAVDEVPVGMEPGKDNNFWTPHEKKLSEMSMDAPISATGDDDDSITVGETVASEQDTAEDTENKVTLSELMSSLPDDEFTKKFKEVVDMYYKEDKGLDEIAEKFGVSKQAVSQWMKKGLEMLRAKA